jgi:hypothetical protein
MTDPIIPKFRCLQWRRQKNRGWLAIVECDRERSRQRPGFQNVIIDGERFKVAGFEVAPAAVPIAKGERIALLCKGRADTTELNDAIHRYVDGKGYVEDSSGRALSMAAEYVAKAAPKILGVPVTAEQAHKLAIEALGAFVDANSDRRLVKEVT